MFDVNEFTIANDLLNKPEKLRAAAREEGYLFFRGLLEREAILSVRRQILGLCAKAGWLAPGTDPMEGIAAPGAACVEPQPDFMVVYNQIMKMEDFHALAHQPALLAMFDTLFDEQTAVHARNIARIIFPHNTKFTTPAHQDYIHIQGTEETWTAWIPLGDCPRDLGSLAVMPRSHHSGVYPVHDAYGAGGKGIDTDKLPYEWLSCDFTLGDVVVFHSLTVHKALPNLSPDRLRLSVDYRYQGVSRPATEGSFLPHYAQLSWEEIYAGWKSTRFQYYWRNLPLRFVEWSPKYHRTEQG
jgi:ectoine hydroxylase-related dioxygenase (phytanoyl-CoA dioxygenase family)